MKMTTKIAILIGIVSILFSSCLKPVTYPVEPAITFKDFTPAGDSGLLTFSFTDGDGDIGLTDADTLDPYTPGTYFYYNLYLQYYEKMNGVWVKGTADPNGNNFPTADSIVFAYRIENITPTGQNKALKGDVKIILEPSYFNHNSHYNDSIKYSITFIDRALHVSNTVETPLILTH